MNDLFGNSVLEVGNLDKNLVLKTAGRIKILFGRKFIDLLDGNGNLNPSLINIIKKVSSLDKISSDGFYYCDDTIVACISGKLVELASTSGNIYVSFLLEQKANGNEKYQALKNIGFIYDSLSDIENYPTNGIIYVELEKSLYVITNGNISKYEGNIPNPITTLIVITKDDNLEGALIISGTGINNSIKFNNLRIYNNENLDSIFSSGGTLIFSVDNREVANINSEGLRVKGILSLNANDSKGFNIYLNNDNDFVLNIDIIKVRKNILFKDSTLYSPEFGLDLDIKTEDEENDNKYLKYPRYSDELYEKLEEDLKSNSDNYKYLVLPYGAIKTLVESYVKQYVKSSQLSIGDRYWYVDNYLVDIAIDDYVTRYYNLSVKAKSDSEVVEGDWESYSKDKRTILMQSALIPSAEDGTFYATKYFKFEKIYDCKYTLDVNFQENVNFKTYEFKEISSSEYDENNNHHYKIEGAFAGLGLMSVNNTDKELIDISESDLAGSEGRYIALFDIDGDTLKVYDIVFDGTGYTRGEKYDSYLISDFAGTTTVPGFDRVEPHLTFLKNIQNIGDSAGRGPTYRVNRGRTRPLNTNSSTGTGRYGMREHSVSEATGHRLNSIFNRTLVLRYAENEKMFLGAITVDEINADPPASYPSGHASLTWAVAMLLALAFNDNLQNVKKYMRNAYMVGLERSIARFHWNSDIMYGRLFSTMVMPIINANGMFDNSYNNFVEYEGLTHHIESYPTNSDYSEEFNSLIDNFDMIDPSGALSYLNAMYSDAIEIFDNYTNGTSTDYSFLFTTIDVTDPVYYEVFPSTGVSIKYTDLLSKTIKFRGENTTYNVSGLTRKDIYISWFIGLCLSELYADSGESINTQTLIMAKAYALGGGRELDLYNEYKIDYDPMILRYAASAVYMILRGRFSRSALRDSGIGNYANFDITDDWLGFSGSNFSDSYILGYCVDTYAIFPNAPGPHNETYGSGASELKSSKSYESKSVGSDLGLTGSQRKEQFITSAEVSSSSSSGSSGSGTSDDSSEYKVNIKVINRTSYPFYTNGQALVYFDGESLGVLLTSNSSWSSNRVIKLPAGETREFKNCRVTKSKGDSSAPSPSTYASGGSKSSYGFDGVCIYATYPQLNSGLGWFHPDDHTYWMRVSEHLKYLLSRVGLVGSNSPNTSIDSSQSSSTFLDGGTYVFIIESGYTIPGTNTLYDGRVYNALSDYNNEVSLDE